ncbi:glycosyltransferase family 2 protein [bacterium]|nr:glycosyltransferase family 2 protein [bacterium]
MTALVLLLKDGERELREGVMDCLLSLNPAPTEWVVVDDGSKDRGSDLVKEKLPQATLVSHNDTEGFARSANDGIRATEAPTLCLLNQDCRLPVDWLGRAQNLLFEKKRAAATSGALIRKDGRVDSEGHLLWSDWVCTEKGEGLEPNKCDEPQEVFGLSATAPVFRREALDAVAIEGMIFDESFGSYLEDVDLNIRLRHLGWQSWLFPGKPAVHDRGSTGARKALAIRRQGGRNYLRYLVKNLSEAERRRAAFPCAVGHLWGFFRDPLAATLGLGETERLFFSRNEIRERRTATDREIAKWISGFRLNPWRKRR